MEEIEQILKAHQRTPNNHCDQENEFRTIPETIDGNDGANMQEIINNFLINHGLKQTCEL